MKILTESYKSSEEICKTITKNMYITIDNIITKYVTDKNTGQTHQMLTIYLSDEHSSILFEIRHNKVFDGIRFYESTRNLVPPLYIPSIHFSVDIKELFIDLFGYDYIHKIIKDIKHMDEDGNINVSIFFHQSLPRTDSLKEFYLEMYRNHVYKMELKEEIIYIKPFINKSSN